MWFFFVCMLTGIWEKVIVRGQKGTNGNDVALCFDDAEQVLDYMRADGSIMHVYFLCALLLARRAAFRCLFTEPRWLTLWCQVLLCRCVVPALSAIIFFIMFFVCFSITAHVQKEKKKKKGLLAFIYVHSGGFKAAILKVRVTLCKRLRKGRPNQCFLQVEHYNTTWFSIRTVIELL